MQSVETYKDQDQLANPTPGQSRVSVWGWLPVLTLIGSFGLLLISIANLRWREQATGAPVLFWIGLLIIVVPVAVRLAFPDISREERIALIIVLALILYGVKLVNSPLSFKNYDELLHARTANDILQTGGLFSYHPILPISPYYPGMENIVSALNKISGFDVYWAGIIAVGMGRIVLVICLFMFYRRVSGSGQLAGIATLLYMANPSFLYFDAMFSYESLALPFAGLVLFAITRWLYAKGSSPFSLTVVMAIAIAAVVVTHHITTYAIVGIVVLWAIVDSAHRLISKDSQPHIGWTPALFALVLGLIWVLYVATRTINYLAPEVSDSVQKLAGFLAGGTTGRELFSTPVGTKAPFIEQFSGYAAVALIMIFLAMGLFQIWKHHLKNIPYIMLGIGAVSYPLTQAFRLVHTNADIPSRSVEFVFLPLALVAALGIISLVFSHTRFKAPVKYIITAIICGTIFIGGVAVGWKPLAPGPYMVSAGNRSVDAESVAAAQWEGTGLGPNHRIAADRINGLLMVAYGDQYQVTLSEDWIPVPDVFFAQWIGPQEGYLLWEGKIDYLVVDERLSTELPYLGFYFEQGETGAFQYTMPINPAALSKFDLVKRISRIYDNGSVRIYDVRKAWNEP